MSGDYKDLRVWHDSMELVRSIYQVSRQFPKEELFGLVSQIRRSAVSVPSNIAEGKGRYSQKELIQFLYRARGSLLELETQVLIAEDLAYIDAGTSRSLISQILDLRRMLNGLVNSFQRTASAGEL